MTAMITYPANDTTPARTMAYGLGWFSIVLGLAQLAAPRQLKRSIGAPGPTALLQGYGAREIASGIAILASKNPNPMVWGRVAGDIVDIATLVPALRADNPRRGAATGAMAFVLLATAADVFCAMQDGRPRRRVPDYSDRSGFGDGAAAAVAG